MAPSSEFLTSTLKLWPSPVTRHVAVGPEKTAIFNLGSATEGRAERSAARQATPT